MPPKKEKGMKVKSSAASKVGKIKSDVKSRAKKGKDEMKSKAKASMISSKINKESKKGKLEVSKKGKLDVSKKLLTPKKKGGAEKSLSKLKGVTSAVKTKEKDTPGTIKAKSKISVSKKGSKIEGSSKPAKSSSKFGTRKSTMAPSKRNVKNSLRNSSAYGEKSASKKPKLVLPGAKGESKKMPIKRVKSASASGVGYDMVWSGNKKTPVSPGEGGSQKTDELVKLAEPEEMKIKKDEPKTPKEPDAIKAADEPKEDPLEPEVSKKTAKTLKVASKLASKAAKGAKSSVQKREPKGKGSKAAKTPEVGKGKQSKATQAKRTASTKSHSTEFETTSCHPTCSPTACDFKTGKSPAPPKMLKHKLKADGKTLEKVKIQDHTITEMTKSDVSKSKSKSSGKVKISQPIEKSQKPKISPALMPQKGVSAVSLVSGGYVEKNRNSLIFRRIQDYKQLEGDSADGFKPFLSGTDLKSSHTKAELDKMVLMDMTTNEQTGISPSAGLVTGSESKKTVAQSDSVTKSVKTPEPSE